MRVIRTSDMEAAKEFYNMLSLKTKTNLISIIDCCRTQTDIIYGYVTAIADYENIILFEARNLTLTLCKSEFLNSINS